MQTDIFTSETILLADLVTADTVALTDPQSTTPSCPTAVIENGSWTFDEPAPARDDRTLEQQQNAFWLNCAREFLGDMALGFRTLIADWAILATTAVAIGMIFTAMPLVVALNSHAFAVLAAFVIGGWLWLMLRSGKAL